MVSFTGKDQIQGWKEIAAYFGRDERTVKRWEKLRGLPVRRIPGKGRASVYLLVSDLETWLADTQSKIPDTPVDSELPSQAVLEQGIAPPPTATIPSAPVAARSISDGRLDAGAVQDPETTAPTFAVTPVPPPASFLGRFTSSLSLSLVFAALVLILGVFTVRSVFFVGHSEAKPLSFVPPRAASAGPRSPAAETYLQAIYFYEQRTPASLDRALKTFTDAIARDSGYAPAYAGLANTYLLMREYSNMDPAEAYAKAKVAATRAVELDPNLPEAHASLGFIDFFSAWDAPAATREFQTALELDPNCVIARHWYGSMLTHEARYPEAIEQLDIAQRLQPTSSAILSSRAYALGLGGHREEAVRMLQTVVATDPGAASPHRILAVLSLLDPHDLDGFLAEQKQFDRIRGDQQAVAMNEEASEAFHRSGEAAMWAVLLAHEQRLPRSAEGAYRIAQAEVELGHRERALSQLNSLATQRSSAMMGVALDPHFIVLHHSPEFQNILSVVGLPPSS